MKKVGILTFHFGDNYGAILQCYALAKTISEFGFDTEVINYIPDWRPKRYSETDLEVKYLSKLEKFNSFRKKYLPVKEKRITDTKNISGYDIYVVGSDQIWNITFPFFNDIYFLNGLDNNSIKISYAASIGMNMEQCERYANIFEKFIPDFDFISLREGSYIKFIQRYSEKKVYKAVDPAMLLSSDDYKILINNKNKQKEKFIFYYYIKHDDDFLLLNDLVNKLSRLHSLEIIHSFIDMPDYIFRNNSRSMYFEGIEDFLWYIQNAEIIITNSFHVTVFSILFKKDFYSYPGKNMGERISELLTELELQDRIIIDYKAIQKKDKPIDYNKIYNLIEDLRSQSLNFIDSALKGNELHDER